MPDLIWEIDDADGVFLTFDDGPTPGITEWILSTLDKYDAKATFFVLGKNVEMYPDLYRRALAIEENAMPHLKTVKGLGRNYAWKERYGME